jgi:hypothetical protein
MEPTDPRHLIHLNPEYDPPDEHGEEASVTDRQLRDLVSHWRRMAALGRTLRSERNENIAAGYAAAATDLENLLRGEPLRG